MIDWRRSEKLVRDLVEREGPSLRVEIPIYDPSFMEYLEGERDDVPENIEERGVVIIPI